MTGCASRSRVTKLETAVAILQQNQLTQKGALETTLMRIDDVRTQLNSLATTFASQRSLDDKGRQELAAQLQLLLKQLSDLNERLKGL